MGNGKVQNVLRPTDRLARKKGDPSDGGLTRAMGDQSNGWSKQWATREMWVFRDGNGRGRRRLLHPRIHHHTSLIDRNAQWVQGINYKGTAQLCHVTRQEQWPHSISIDSLKT